MLEIAICDDEILVTSNIEKMIESLADKIAVDVSIDIFYDGSTLVPLERGKALPAQNRGITAEWQLSLIHI